MFITEKTKPLWWLYLAVGLGVSLIAYELIKDEIQDDELVADLETKIENLEARIKDIPTVFDADTETDISPKTETSIVVEKESDE